MKIVVFASRKGGTGKSTLAINIAVLAGRSRLATCLIDMDPQASVAAWKRLREQRGIERPSVEICRPDQLRRLLTTLRASHFDLACLDTPPDIGPTVRAALQVATLIVIPVRPDVVNFDAVTHTIRLARKCGKPYLVVINEAPSLRDDYEAPLVGEARRQVMATGADAGCESAQEWAPSRR